MPRACCCLKNCHLMICLAEPRPILGLQDNQSNEAYLRDINIESAASWHAFYTVRRH